MSYKRYHLALVFSIVLQALLRGTSLEYKALFLYGDIIELENVSDYHIKTAKVQAEKLLQAINNNTIQAPSPFTFWQRIKMKWRAVIIWVRNLHQEK